MGLGRLNPGCRQECGCEGCFGSLTIVGNCEIRWTTSGDPFAVELLRDGVLVSNAESGSIYSPDSGTYSLRIRCAEADGWTVIDTVVYVAPVNGCPTCCESIGRAPIFGSTVAVDLFMGPSPWSTWFNGSYILNKRLTCPGGPSENICAYDLLECTGGVISTPTYQWPVGQPGNYVSNVNFKCTKLTGANLYANGYYAGQTSIAIPGGTRVFEVWYLPRKLDISVVFGSTGGSQPKKQTVNALATINVYLVVVDQINTSGTINCYAETITTASVGAEITCGSSSVSSPVIFTPPASIATPYAIPSSSIPSVPVSSMILSVVP